MATSARQRPAIYSTPALEKGLDVLEALASSETSLSLSDFAKALGRTSSELFRVLNALDRRSYVLKDPGTGRYRLSLKLFELAHLHPPVQHLLASAEEPMRKLAHSLRQSCHLSVLSSGKLVVLAETGSPEAIRLAIAVGSSFSPIHTASGRLLLAGLQGGEREAFLGKDRDYRRKSTAQKKRLRDVLDRIREAGYSTAENETYVGIRDVAVPVGNPRVGVAAALDLTLWIHPDHLFHITEVLSTMRRHAKNITRAMGVTPR